MNHNDTVKQSFKKQAEKFAAYHMSKMEYTDYLVKRIGAKGNEHALEVAAGTCICGRALAPFVKDITCLDLTGTPEDTQKEITDLVKADLSGGCKTGFSPYIKDSKIMFDHRWLLLIGIKN